LISVQATAIRVVLLAREPHDDRAATLLELGIAPDETAAENVQRGAQHVVHHLDVGVVDDFDLLPVRGLDVVRLEPTTRLFARWLQGADLRELCRRRRPHIDGPRTQDLFLTGQLCEC